MDMSKDFTNHSYGYAQKFTDNYPFFSEFLYISRFFFVSLHPKIRCT